MRAQMRIGYEKGSIIVLLSQMRNWGTAKTRARSCTAAGCAQPPSMWAASPGLAVPPERPAGSASRRQALAPLFGELLRIRRRNHSPLPPAAPTRTGGAGTPKVPGRSWWEGEGGGAAEPGRQVRPSVRLSFFPPSLRFPSLPPPSRFVFFFFLA